MPRVVGLPSAVVVDKVLVLSGAGAGAAGRRAGGGVGEPMSGDESFLLLVERGAISLA